MPTVAQLASRVETINNDLAVLQGKIQESYDSLVKGATTELGGLDLKLKKEMQELAQRESEYNVLFQEEEASRQAMGGKSRKQTLQEFVLLFFYISLAVLSVTLLFYSLATGGFIQGAKMLAMCFVVGLVVTAILIRYA
jgi:paraquat-inducible protein B